MLASARGVLRCRTIPRAHTVRPYTFINPGKMASLFYKIALSPAPCYAIIQISCRKTSGAVGKNRFVWQPAMRKEFMYEEQ